MSEIKEFMDAVVAFRDARYWKKFHQPKDMAIGAHDLHIDVKPSFYNKLEKTAKKYLVAQKEKGSLGS